MAGALEYRLDGASDESPVSVTSLVAQNPIFCYHFITLISP